MSMKKIFTSISLIFTLFSFAQISGVTDSLSKNKKILIGVCFSPDYCYRALKSDAIYSSYGISFRDQIEKPKFGYSIGIRGIYKASDLVELEMGILYTNKGYRSNYDNTYTPAPQIVPASSSSNALFAEQITYNFYYLDIPFKVNFICGKGKIRFITSLGMVIEALILTTSRDNLSDIYGNRSEGTFNISTNFNKINLSPMISIGLENKLHGRMSLRAEPYFQYGILPLLNTTVKENLWNAGLKISMFYHL